MDTERAYELQVIAPYRKALKRGDVFAMKFDDSFFLHGHIVSTEAVWTGRAEDGLINLIYVYDRIASRVDDYDVAALSPSRLLVPPILTPRVGWSRGYFSVVAHIPLTPGDVLERHVFKKSANREWYFDDAGNEVETWDGPVGLYAGFTSSSIQLAVLHALGLKCKGYDDVANPRL